MEPDNEINERYISKLEKHIEIAKESSKYSLDRFDILIISLSTSALVLSIGFVKDVVPHLDKINTSLLKTAWLLFVVSLISNLISQVTGFYANSFDIRVTNNLVRKERGRSFKGKQNLFIRYCNILSNITTSLNGVSLFSLIGGIISLLIFFSIHI